MFPICLLFILKRSKLFQMTSKNFVLAMEYCDGGSLYSMLDQPKYFYGLPEEEFLIVLYDIGKVTDSSHELHTVLTYCIVLVSYCMSQSMYMYCKQSLIDTWLSWHTAWSSKPHNYYIRSSTSCLSHAIFRLLKIHFC